jgi:hypothetical protein
MTASDPKPDSAPPQGEPSFEQQAHAADPGIVREFLQFLVENKAWWLAPILMALVLLGLVVFLSGSGLAPFIYPLF